VWQGLRDDVTELQSVREASQAALVQESLGWWDLVWQALDHPVNLLNVATQQSQKDMECKERDQSTRTLLAKDGGRAKGQIRREVLRESI
jgi:hypothetical protein